MVFAEYRRVTVLEAIIIYLSAGAPFGVLVFFSQRPAPIPVAAFRAVTTALAWPLFGSYRLYRGLTRQKTRQLKPGSDATPNEVLRRIAVEVPVETSELFEIAGHPNPWLATNCYARARKRVIASHLDRLSRIPSHQAVDPAPVSQETVFSGQFASAARS